MKEAAIEGNNVAWAFKTYGDAFKSPTGRILIRKLNGMGAKSWPDRMFLTGIRRKLDGETENAGKPLDGMLRAAMSLFTFARIWFIEYKKPGKWLEPLQEQMVNAIRRLGFRVYVVDSREEGRRIIAAEMEGNVASGYDGHGRPHPPVTEEGGYLVPPRFVRTLLKMKAGDAIVGKRVTIKPSRKTLKQVAKARGVRMKYGRGSTPLEV